MASSQLVFVGMLVVATALDPAVATHRDEGGVSNFGVHAATVVPYALGFAGAAVLLWLAAAALAPSSRGLAVGLRWLAAALVAVLGSTFAYQHGPALHGLHVAVATAASVYETAFGIWLAACVARDALGLAACAVQVAAAAVALGALLSLEHRLFAAQLVGAAAFAVLVVHATARATREG